MPLTIASNAMTDSGDYFVPTPYFSNRGAMPFFIGEQFGKPIYADTPDTSSCGYYYSKYNSFSQWEIWEESCEEGARLLDTSLTTGAFPWVVTWFGQECKVNLNRNVDIVFKANISSSYIGYRNILLGGSYGSLFTASENICIGENYGTNLSTGTKNISIGAAAMQGIATGTRNTAVGYGTLSSTNINNSSCFGNGAQVTGSNQVQLGNSATTTYAYGAVQNRSDERDKTVIKDTELGLEFVNALRPVDFKWDMREDYRPEAPVAPSENATEEEKVAYETAKAKWLEDVKLANITHDGSKTRNRFHHGLIAQEVKAVLDAKGIDFGGFQDHKIAGGDDVLSIGYGELIAPMIKAIQELSAEVASLKAKLNP
jgi:hypothetical protein